LTEEVLGNHFSRKSAEALECLRMAFISATYNLAIIMVRF